MKRRQNPRTPVQLLYVVSRALDTASDYLNAAGRIFARRGMLAAADAFFDAADQVDEVEVPRLPRVPRGRRN